MECSGEYGVFKLVHMAGKRTLTGKRGLKAYTLLHQIHDRMEQSHIPYVLEAGTLLGLVREGRLLPWDNDIDFTITDRYLERLPMLISNLRQAGLRVKIRTYNEAVGFIPAGSVRLIKVGVSSFPFIKQDHIADIFVKYKHQDQYFWSVGDPNPVLKSTPSTFYDQTTTLHVQGKSFSVPLDTHGYLAYHYGPSWKTPITNWDFRYDDHCIKYPPPLPLYFVANSIYQFAYALPVYRKTGGVFVVNGVKKWLHFKWFLRNQRVGKPQGLCNTPKVKIVPPGRLAELKGVLFFFANSIRPFQVHPNAITLFHEHGTSDKKYENGHPIAVQKLLSYHYIVLSGPKNRERLKDIHCFPEEKKMVNAGCLRFDDYVSGTFDGLHEKRKLGIVDMERPVVLYAPTWRFGNGTLHKLWSPFVNEITKTFSLVIRPHYHDRKAAYVKYLLEMAKGTPHLYFSNPNDIIHQDTYAAFAASDLMISDMSSVLYEYLITRKPMIAIQNDFPNKHKMPPHMDVMQHIPIYDGSGPITPMIQDAIQHKERISIQMEKLLNHCFYHTEGDAVSSVVSLVQQIRSATKETDSR